MQLRIFLQFLTVILFWGASWIAIKFELGVTAPGWSVSFRFLLAGLALLLWCGLRGQPLLLPKHAWPFVLAVALFQFVLNFNFVYSAEQYVPSAIPAVAFALLMVPNAILARLFLQSRVTKRFVIGSALGIAGVGLLFTQQLTIGADYEKSMLGLGLVVGAVLTSSIVNVMQATPKATSFPPLTGLAWAMLLGAAIDGVFSFAYTGPPVLDPKPSYWIALLYLALFAGAIAYAVYFDLVRRIGPAKAAWTSVMVPILAMAISTLFEDFHLTLSGGLGCVLAISGLVIALAQPKRDKRMAVVAATPPGTTPDAFQETQPPLR